MLRGEANYDIIAVEPASCPSLTRGKYAYDFCDTGKVCPLAKMYTLGSGFIPSANHAGGLRYHGMSSVVSELYNQGYLTARSVEQTEVFKAAEQFARVEGILPAPESSHAIKVAIDEAMKCKETGEAKNIVFGLTGTGYFDMVAYQRSRRHIHIAFFLSVQLQSIRISVLSSEIYLFRGKPDTTHVCHLESGRPR